MKLVACHIENFGNLSDFDYTFSDGLNTIVKENGWGKSTFLAFLCVMLYGFENETKRKNSERSLYKPWAGGVYGGSLTVKTEAGEYVIYRSFGEKQSDDSYEVRDKKTNLKLEDFGVNPGEKIFGLARESFEKTVAITQNHCDTNVNGNINQRLGNISEDSRDETRFEEAEGILKKEMNSLNPDRKPGRIKVLNEEISGLEKQLKTKASLLKTMDEINSKISEAKENESAIQEKLKKLSDSMSEQAMAEKQIARKNEYTKLIEELKEREAERDESRKVFKNDIPERAEIDNYVSLKDKYSELKGQLKACTLSPEERNRYKELQEIYGEKKPVQEELDSVKSDITTLISLEDEIKNLSIPRESLLRYDELKILFKNGMPEGTEIAGVEEAVRKEGELTQDIRQLVLEKELAEKGYLDEKQREEARVKSKKRTNIIIGIVIILLAVGLVFISPYLAIIGLAGIVLFLIPVKQKNVDGKEKLEELEEKIVQNNELLDQYKNQIADFKKIYLSECYTDNITMAIYELRKNMQEYIRLDNLIKSTNTSEKEKQRDALVQKIYEYLVDYKPLLSRETTAFQKAISEIDKELFEYKSLNKKENEENALSEQTEPIAEKLNSFLERYGFKENQDIAGIIRDLEMYEKAAREYKGAMLKKESFEKDNPDFEEILSYEIKDNPGMDKLDEERIAEQQSLNTVIDSIKNYEKQKDTLSEELEALYKIEDQLALKKEELVDNQKRYMLVEKTREYLIKARQQYTLRYTEPVKKGFDKYYELVSQEDSSLYSLDADMVLTKKVLGLERGIERLSHGQQDLSGICMRLGLIEAMFTDELPFLLLDDSFVNLDNNKLNGAMKLMKQVAEEYQIIYLTCSNERNIV